MRNTCFFVVLSLALLSEGCALWRQIFPEGVQMPDKMPAGSIKMPGSYSRAGEVALGAVLKRLADQVEEARSTGDYPPDAAAAAFVECYLRPESYDVYVGYASATNRYVVMVFPVAERCLGGQAQVLDGGGTFEIDATSFAIVDPVAGNPTDDHERGIRSATFKIFGSGSLDGRREDCRAAGKPCRPGRSPAVEALAEVGVAAPRGTLAGEGAERSERSPRSSSP